MSHQVASQRPARMDATDQPDQPTSEELFTLLGDDLTREILQRIAEEPLPARALADRLDVARSTVYRRLDRLEDAGLVEASMTYHPDGHHRRRFVTQLDESRTIDAASPRDAIDPSQMRELDQPLFLLGNAVEDPATGIHGDEAFLYEIDVSQGPSADLADWTVRVSAHCGFPRWDGPTAAAFEQAKWQFEGSLPAAHEEFVDGA